MVTDYSKNTFSHPRWSHALWLQAELILTSSIVIPCMGTIYFLTAWSIPINQSEKGDHAPTLKRVNMQIQCIYSTATDKMLKPCTFPQICNFVYVRIYIDWKY